MSPWPLPCPALAEKKLAGASLLLAAPLSPVLPVLRRATAMKRETKVGAANAMSRTKRDT